MAADEPPYLTVGTDVSAKYKGAFCEAKIKKVNRTVKCKVTFKNGQGTGVITDDQIRGTLRVGAHVEAKHPEKNQYMDAIINKVQDYSQYTVVFDDGDETTLRRTSLCLKSGRHFAESPTLDQFPLTNPEHFGTPVIGSKAKRKRRSTMNSASVDDDSSDEESSPKKVKEARGREKDPDLGKVVCVDFGDKRKKESWYPGLVVSVSAQDTIKINTKEDYLVRSFKDGKYYQVMKKETRDFTKEIGSKADNNTLRTAVEKALAYLDRDELPPHWDRALLMGLDQPSADEDSHDSDSDTSDDEPSEEKDRFVAQLYKFMDERGTPINKAPTVGSRDLNLYKLFKIVHKMGGYNRVTNQNQWRNVYIKMGLPASNPASSHQIKQAYKRYLHSFEDFYRKLGCTMVTNIRSTRVRHRSDRNIIMTRNRDRDISASRGRQQSKESKDRKDEKQKHEEEKKEDKQRSNELKKTEERQIIDEVKKSPEKQIDDVKKDLEKLKSDGRKSLDKPKNEDVKKPLDKPKEDVKKGLEKQKDEGRRSLERQKNDDSKKNFEKQKCDELKKGTDKQKIEEIRKIEKRPDEGRRSLERLKVDESKKFEKLKTDGKKVIEKQKNDDRKKSPEKLRNDGKKLSEKLKNDDSKKLPEKQKNDDKKLPEKAKIENIKKFPEKQKSEERRKSPEKQKIEECKKLSEKKIDDGKKIEKQKNANEEFKRTLEKPKDETSRKTLDRQKSEDFKKNEKQKIDDSRISEKQKLESKKMDKQKLDKEEEKNKIMRSRTPPQKVEKEVNKEEEKNKVEKVEKARTREDARREKAESPEKKETRSSVKIDQERERREKEDIEKKLMKEKEKREKIIPKDLEKKEKIIKKEDKIIKEKKEEKVLKETERADNKSLHLKPKPDQEVENLQKRKLVGKKKLDKPEEKEEKRLKDSDNEDELVSRDVEEKREDDIEVGDRVKVKYRYGRGRQHKIYEAKVLKIDKENGEKRFFVHYTGWNMRYDEWVKRNSIVENMSIKSRTTRRKKQVFTAKGVFVHNISGKRGRPPTALFAGKLTRKNSASSTSSVVSSRTTRSDRNSLTESPFAAGLEPRRRTRKKSGVSVADASHDSESEVEPETPELNPEIQEKQEKEIQEVQSDDLVNKIEVRESDLTKDHNELNQSYELELPELKREDEWKDIRVEKKDLSELDTSVDENKDVSELDKSKDDISEQDHDEEKDSDSTKEQPKIPKRRGRSRKIKEQQTPPKTDTVEAEEERKKDDEKANEKILGATEQVEIFSESSKYVQEEMVEVDRKEDNFTSHLNAEILKVDKENDSSVSTEETNFKVIDKTDSTVKIEIAISSPSEVSSDTNVASNNFSTNGTATIDSHIDTVSHSPCLLPPDPLTVDNLSPLKPAISIEATVMSAYNIPSNDPSTISNDAVSSVSDGFENKPDEQLTCVAPDTSHPPLSPTESFVDTSSTSVTEEVCAAVPVNIIALATPEYVPAFPDKTSNTLAVLPSCSSASDKLQFEPVKEDQQLSEIDPPTIQEDMTELKDDILEQVEKNIEQIEKLEKSLSKRDAESDDDYESYLSQKQKRLKLDNVENSFIENKAISPLSDVFQVEMLEDNSTIVEVAVKESSQLLPSSPLASEMQEHLDDPKIELNLKENNETDTDRYDTGAINNLVAEIASERITENGTEATMKHEHIEICLDSNVDNRDDIKSKTEFPVNIELLPIENIEKLEKILEINKDVSEEPAESKLDSSTVKKESKKKKSKGLKQDKKQSSQDSADKDEAKSKEGKKSKKKSKEHDDADKTKDSESRPKSKKMKDKKNKNKKRSERPDSDADVDISKKLDIRDDDNAVEKIKKKDKKKKDDRKSNKSGYRSDENNETKSETKKKKGKKNKDKFSSEKKGDGSSDKKSKKKKKGHAEIDTADSDSEKEGTSKTFENEKSGKSSKKKKDKKKTKVKDSSSSDDASEARLPKDISGKKHSKSSDIAEAQVELVNKYTTLDTRNEEDPDMSFLLCEEKVPASPVGVDTIPEESSGSSSIEGNSSPGQSASEIVERIDSVSGEPYSRPESIQPSDGISKHDPEACAVLDNTPPTTPESSESVLSSSPSHERESYSLPDAESTRSGRESGEGESDSFHGESREQDTFESEEYRAATTLFSVCTSIPEKIKESSRTERSLKRQKSETEEVSPSKKRKKSSKRLHTTTESTKSGHHAKHKGSFSKSSKDGKDSYEISGANSAVFSSPPHSSTSSHQIVTSPAVASHSVALSSDGATHLLPRPSKFNFYVPLDDYKDADKRISVLQERLSELRKTYMALKAEVALIDRRRKKAKKKEKEPVSSASGSTSTLQSDEVQCSS